jgi:uncharacterized membrane protein YfcA
MIDLNTQTAFIFIILFVASLVRSSIGFGDALISMPLLVILLGTKTATPLVALVASVNALLILLSDWRSVRFRAAWRLILYTFLGIPLGLLFLKSIDEKSLKLVLGLVIISFSAFRLFKPQDLDLSSDRLAPFFGLIAGLLGGAFNINGPPVVVYGILRQWPPAHFRATLQGYFFPTGLLIILGHGVSGLWTRQIALYFVCGLPFVILAFWIGKRLHQRIAPQVYARVVHGFLILAGLFLVVQSI